MTDSFAGFPVLGELDPALLQRVLARCRTVAFADGEIILQRGAVNRHLHFVLSGSVQVHFDLADRSAPLERGAGQMFGEMSVIDRLPASAYVIAAGPCRLLLLPDDLFWSDVVTVPGVARSVMRALSGLVRRDTLALMQAMQERLRHAALERELLLARDIQMGMLKRENLRFPGRDDFSIAANIEPARQVGGDFYEAFLLDADHLALAIGDVSGKGISAALFMVRALTLLRSSAPGWRSLADTLTSINRMLAADNEASMFITLFMAVLDLRSGGLEYINHGHPPPLIRAPDGATGFHGVAPGIVFGLFEDAQGAAGHTVLPPGATLLLYSDGVTEAMDPEQRQLGPAGLLDAVTRADTHDPAALIAAIAASVGRHAGAAEQADDITLVATHFRRRG
jgi:sigma-B regulation protein RsbU (phosphoserine phosphatase)